jgi:hypothetical protein
MSILGHASEKSWPGIVHTQHWKRNTQDIRTPRPEYQERLEQHLLHGNQNLAKDSRHGHAVDLIKKCAPSFTALVRSVRRMRPRRRFYTACNVRIAAMLPNEIVIILCGMGG